MNIDVSALIPGSHSGTLLWWYLSGRVAFFGATMQFASGAIPGFLYQLIAFGYRIETRQLSVSCPSRSPIPVRVPLRVHLVVSL